MKKMRFDEWYFYNSCNTFIKEIEFAYYTYTSYISNIYGDPNFEAENYVKHLEKCPQELESFSPDDAFLEINSKGMERYYFIVNMKYRNIAIYINLLYQMFEQFIISICKFQQQYHSMDPVINELNLRDLHKCNNMFKKYDFDLESLKEYEKINELRLLHNVLKHSEGNSEEELRKIRPDFFIKNEKIFTVYKNTIIDATLNISEADLNEYVITIKNFLAQIPNKLTHKYEI